MNIKCNLKIKKIIFYYHLERDNFEALIIVHDVSRFIPLRGCLVVAEWFGAE